jgi:hypothetical protein
LKPKKIEGKGLLNTLTHETMARTMGKLITTDAESQKKQMSTTFQSALKKDIDNSSPQSKKASKIVRFKEETE